MSEKSKNILLGVLIVGLVSMTVAYAALSTTLTISGTASVDETEWNVHFDNWQLQTTSNTAGAAQNTAVATPVAELTKADATNATAFSGVNVQLKQPGDNVKYTFDIVNTGTIDAKLSNFQKSITDTSDNTKTGTDTLDGITYTITCDPANSFAAGSEQVLVKKTGVTHCTLDVIYDPITDGGVHKQTSQEAGKDQTMIVPARSFDIAASWNYVQK